MIKCGTPAEILANKLGSQNSNLWTSTPGWEMRENRAIVKPLDFSMRGFEAEIAGRLAISTKVAVAGEPDRPSYRNPNRTANFLCLCD